MKPKSDDQLRVLHADARTATILGVAWSPNGARLAAAGETAGVSVWRVATGERLLVYPEQGLGAATVGWSPDGTRIASANGPVDVWDPATGERILTYEGVVSVLAWSPDGTRIVSAGLYGNASGWEREAQVWDARTGERLVTYRGHGDTINALAWSPDGTRIVSGSGDDNGRARDTTTQIWDARTGVRLFTRMEEEPVLAVGWSPDGSSIASVAHYNTVEVWDAATGERRCTFREHRGKVQALAWSPDGRRIASADWDSTVQVWDSVTAERIYTYEGHYFGDPPPHPGGPRPQESRGRADLNWVWSVAWSPDGRHIASGGCRASISGRRNGRATRVTAIVSDPHGNDAVGNVLSSQGTTLNRYGYAGSVSIR